MEEMMAVVQEEHNVEEEQHSGNSTHRYSSWYRRGGTVGIAHTGTVVGTGGAAQWE
jgi:hypothetical protein